MAMLKRQRKVKRKDKFAKVTIREPVVAGKFYSDNSHQLRQVLDNFFEDAVSIKLQKPMAIIVPHAGYIYSGQIAADAFNQLCNQNYDLVVVLGTNHTNPRFQGVSVYPRKGYRTPLGVAEIDEKIVDELLAQCPECDYHPGLHVREHSIEVQIPFIQYLFPEVKIVPIVVGAPDLNLCENFGKKLVEIVKHRQSVLVASSDLSHYPDFKDAEQVDRRTLEAIVRMDSRNLQSVLDAQMREAIPNLATCACGAAPIFTAITAARERNANCGSIISYANSGHATIGSQDHVVGYGAIAFTQDENCVAGHRFHEPSAETQFEQLEENYKKWLLEFSRKTMHRFLTTEIAPLARGMDPVLNQKRGAFVSLKKKNNLRGCVGHMEPDIPLGQIIGAMTLQAAFNDPRFNSVSLDELSEIKIEISVLTPCRPIECAEEIELGRDGIVLQKDGRHAVFLPQVAQKMKWSREKLLDRLCGKAGLPPGSWKENAKLLTFQADVFCESDFN